MDKRKLIFLSSKQVELQTERDAIRSLVKSDRMLSNLFDIKAFEHDLTGRKEPVDHMTEEWVLKSDIYLSLFDKEFSAPTQREYEIAVRDVQVRKEIIVFVRERCSNEREIQLQDFLKLMMNPTRGHSCVLYNSTDDLLTKVERCLLDYYGRSIEGFILSKKVLGENLEGAKNTQFPEKLRRRLLQPLGRHMVLRGRKGYPEYYVYDWDGQKIDVTWDYIEPCASAEVKEYYRKKYRQPFE